MDSQIQCPVCTLYLHVGMNLQDHLNTHPKEQVISALVNMTLLQQRANDENANNFECSRYEPLADDLYPDKSLPSVSTNGFSNQQQSITYFTPITQQTSHQVMIVNGTPVFPNDRTPVSSKSASRHQIVTKSLPPLSIPTRTFRLIPAKGYDGKITQAIPPPPPYHASIQDSLTMRNALQRNESNQLTTPGQSTNTSSSSTVASATAATSNNNAANTGAAENMLFDTSVSAKSVDNSKTGNHDTLLNAEMHAETEFANANEPVVSDKRCNVQSSAESADNERTDTSSHQHEMNADDSDGDICSSKRHFKEENTDSTSTDADQSPEKRTSGLKVLSNVQVSPNTILNVSSLNSQMSEPIALNNMIIVGSIPSTSSGVNSQHSLASQFVKPKSLLRSVNDSIRNGKILKNSKAKIDVRESGEKQMESTSAEKDVFAHEPDAHTSEERSSTAEECFVKPCSSKATSVIRLASQKSPRQTSSPDTTPNRSTVKAPYNRQVKKLVVKLKKPFVPVIEEEANLHPPEMSSNQVGDILKQEKMSDDTPSKRNGNNSFEEINQNENEVLLECSEDVPFSPLRQSYTPLPMNQQLNEVDNDSGSMIDNGSENDLQIIDVKSINERLEAVKNKQNDECSLKQKRQKSDGQNLETDNDVVIFTITPVDDMEQPEEIVVCENAKPIEISIDKTTVSTIHSEYISSSSSLSSSSSSTATSSSLSTSSNTEPSSSQSNFQNMAGTSRADYGLATFLDYNEQQENNYFNSGVRVRLSPIPFVSYNNNWNQRFSPSYTSFEEADKQSSYMDLDGCKTNSGGVRAMSTDSLNIRTDEKMPAKGEISEQESNGDIEGSWSHQIYPAPESDNMPRYTNSYDTTVARESWSLSNEQNLSRDVENMPIIPLKFTLLEQVDPNLDVKPSTENLLLKEPPKERTFVKARKYRCPVCSQIFATLKEKRIHLINNHDYQQDITSTKILPKITKLTKIKKPIETVTSASCSTLTTIETTTLVECKKDPIETVKPFTSLNNYLLSYNWTTLKAKPGDGTKDENKNLFAIIESGVNYVCKTCEEQFNSIRAYDIHMATHPAECYTCGRTFKRWVNFSIHLKRHLNIREHRCSYCPKRFVLRQNMIEHMRIHNNEAPLKCGLCMKRFKRFSNLIQHRNRHHLKLRPQAKDFICSCGEVFHSQAKIAWHRETHDVKPKCCPYCRERFMHKNSLVRHIRLSHTERFHVFKRDSVECPYCKKKYIKSSLKMHMEQHRESRTTYECTICNKTLTTKWNLKQHKWIHASRSSKPFKCNLCTKAFIRETEYISHMNTHKAIKPYTCDHCGCQFARKYNWLRHTREHETNKKFRCDTCGKYFHRAYYLKEHKRIHTGERPFECVICGKTSTTKTNHNKHVKIHHARDPLTAEA